MYNKAFQTELLLHLLNSEDLLRAACPKLQLSDFELGTFQVVWEALSLYFEKYRAIPTPGLFQLEVARVVNNADGGFKSFISPEEIEGLCELMAYISKADPKLNTEYFKAELPKYVKWVRSHRTMSQYRKSLEEGADPQHIIDSLNEIVRDTTEMSDGEPEGFDCVTEAPEMIWHAEDAERRITTGLSPLDKALDGGPRPGDLGCITACPGTGKTNVLLHFTVVAAYTKVDSLFLSLELPSYKVKRRYMAMLASIPAQTTKLPIDKWETEEMMRLAMVMDKNYVAGNMTVIRDHSKRKVTLPQIEDTIGQWKDSVIARKGSAACPLQVCVDWAKYILPPSSKKDQWESMIEIFEELGRIGRRQAVCVWTANQGSKAADRKTVIRMSDGAFSFHVADPLDISIGLALAEESRITEDDIAEDRTKTRILKWTINKSRENENDILDFFQAPSLRFFDSQQHYNSHLKAIRALTYDTVKAYNLNIPHHLRTAFELKAEHLTQGAEPDDADTRTGTA
jgi:hypothetical protein